MITISDDLMDRIAIYMYDDIREKVHAKFAPCSNEKFLEEYINIDLGFIDVLYNEFSIEL